MRWEICFIPKWKEDVVMQTFVIYDKEAKDAGIKFCNDTEPVFLETDNGIKLKEDAFIIGDLRKEKL